MDNLRIFLWAGVALLLWFNYVTWQRDYAPPPGVASTSVAANSPSKSAADVPELPSSSAAPAAPSAPTASTADTSKAVRHAPHVRVVTDVLDLDVSLQGGELDRADLLQYPVVKGQTDNPVRLFSTAPDTFFVVRSGLRAPDESAAPTHLATYMASQTEYRLAEGQDTLSVPLTWTDGNGVQVTKTYTFKRGSYIIDLSYDVTNQSMSAWQAASYVQLVRHHVPVKSSMFNAETYAYRGPAVFDGKSYRRLKLDDSDDQHYRASATGGWMAAVQHHFVAAAVPPTNVPEDFQLRIDNDSIFSFTYRGPLQSVAPGAMAMFKETLFVGPKLQRQLSSAGPRLERTVDYGKLAIFAQPLFWVLEKVHGVVGNWGWSIIIVTFLIKLAFYKLTATSGRSMAKMRNLTPRIKAIQERYKDDREQLGRAMMDLYKREKVNPVAGCLPILIQIPVFMGFYSMLLESVEMRQTPFMGWVTDLSSRDPYFILPIIMGIAMFGQFKLNPAPPDPMQAKVFAFMPIVMTVMMAWFPAGLVLYWITNTGLSIAQQWRINKLIEGESKKAST